MCHRDRAEGFGAQGCPLPARFAPPVPPCLLLMLYALIGVHKGPGSACHSFMSNASPVLTAATSRKGCCLPETAYEGKLFLPCFASFKSIPAFCLDPAMSAFGTVQDPDSGVRETAADALGQIAEHLSKQQNLLLPGDTASNPVLKAAFDTMLEHKKEMQQAGACTLSQAWRLAPTCLSQTFPCSNEILVHVKDKCACITVDSTQNFTWCWMLNVMAFTAPTET